MSDQAVANDAALGLPLLEVAKLFLDHDFNCRGWFSPTECVELAKDIARNGLQQPICVRELRTVDVGDLKNERSAIDKGYTHKVISGHRRLMAYKINEHPQIPCIVKSADLTLFQEKDLNAIENLHRRELNFLQEANAIRHYWIAGWNRQDIADRIGKSQGWVQLRQILLGLPEDVQELAGQGFIVPNDMHELNKIKVPNELLKAAAILRDKRKSGEKKNILHNIKQKEKATAKKIRKKQELFDMIELLQSTFSSADRDAVITIGELFTPSGNSLTTRLIGWAAGEVDNFGVHKSIQETAELLGLEYDLPEFAPGG